MKKIYRMFVGLLAMCALALSAFASAVTNAVVFVSEAVGAAPVSQKLDAEIAHNKASKVTYNKVTKYIGSGSGDSPLSFVQMLTAINDQSNTAFA